MGKVFGANKANDKKCLLPEVNRETFYTQIIRYSLNSLDQESTKYL